MIKAHLVSLFFVTSIFIQGNSLGAITDQMSPASPKDDMECVCEAALGTVKFTKYGVLEIARTSCFIKGTSAGIQLKDIDPMLEVVFYSELEAVALLISRWCYLAKSHAEGLKPL